jgi:hypothetical protein
MGSSMREPVPVKEVPPREGNPQQGHKPHQGDRLPKGPAERNSAPGTPGSPNARETEVRPGNDGSGAASLASRKGGRSGRFMTFAHIPDSVTCPPKTLPADTPGSRSREERNCLIASSVKCYNFGYRSRGEKSVQDTRSGISLPCLAPIMWEKISTFSNIYPEA